MDHPFLINVINLDDFLYTNLKKILYLPINTTTDLPATL
jgi:hypothetical protein